MNPAPGYRQYPEHRIATKPAGVRVRVRYKGEVIADSRNAVAMEESTGAGKKTVAPTVYYIPRGETYEQPYDEAAAIRELLAFYPDKVEIAVS